MSVFVHLSILLSVYSFITALCPGKKLCIHKYCFCVGFNVLHGEWKT